VKKSKIILDLTYKVYNQGEFIEHLQKQIEAGERQLDSMNRSLAGLQAELQDEQFTVRELRQFIRKLEAQNEAMRNDAELTEQVKQAEIKPAPADTAETVIDWNIDDLNLSVRAYNVLKREGVHTVRDIIDRGFEAVSTMRNMGDRATQEIVDKLDEYGLSFHTQTVAPVPVKTTAPKKPMDRPKGNTSWKLIINRLLEEPAGTKIHVTNAPKKSAVQTAVRKYQLQYEYKGNELYVWYAPSMELGR